MALAGDFEVVRDPLWNNIRIDARALGIVDSAPFQRLRYVRQLGHAYLVYPGATHSRFEHALGAYHLARRSLQLLAERGELDRTSADEVAAVRLALLLHDIGHYPFSHALEEAGLPSHESLAERHLADPRLAEAIAAFGIPDARRRIVELIRGASDSPLQGLVAGSLDLDKIEYLTRDARMCGVPYGTVDVDRLLHSMTLVAAPDGRLKLGVHEKGVSALESLLFAKYQMYRNVYWHHGVRSATAMFKRLVRTALATGRLAAHGLADGTDESLMETVRGLPGTDLPERLRRRALYKRALDLRATEVPAGAGDWIVTRPDLLEAVEDRVSAEFGLGPGALLLDFPAKPEMLAVDLPLRMRDDRVERLGADDRTGLLGIQQIADQLHTGARRFRVFVAEPVKVDRAAAIALAERSADDLAGDLRSERALLAGAR